MRIALSMGVALAACACAETAVEPRSPVRDTFRERVAELQREAPPAPPRGRSVSLGFIGDGRLGTEPTPPYHLPYWERPFPCDWTNTCWLAPPPVYYAPCSAPWAAFPAVP
jgi:hypothetical protein